MRYIDVNTVSNRASSRTALGFTVGGITLGDGVFPAGCARSVTRSRPGPDGAQHT